MIALRKNPLTNSRCRNHLLGKMGLSIFSNSRVESRGVREAGGGQCAERHGHDNVFVATPRYHARVEVIVNPFSPILSWIKSTEIGIAEVVLNALIFEVFRRKIASHRDYFYCCRN